MYILKVLSSFDILETNILIRKKCPSKHYGGTVLQSCEKKTIGTECREKTHSYFDQEEKIA